VSNIKVVMGRGSNASGKTTIAKDLIVMSSDVETWSWNAPLFDGDVDKYPSVYATVMKDIGWAVVGAYSSDKKMGGCDVLGGCHTVWKVQRAVADILNDRGNLKGIYYEGMMISTITSTFYDFMMDLKQYNVDPYFVIFRTTVEGCINRIKSRGTMKPNLNIENIANKCELAIRSGKRLEQLGGIPVKWIDVEYIPKDMMLLAFLHAIGEI